MHRIRRRPKQGSGRTEAKPVNGVQRLQKQKVTSPSKSAAVKNNNDDLAANVKSFEKRMCDFFLSMEKSAAAVEDLKREVAKMKKPAT